MCSASVKAIAQQDFFSPLEGNAEHPNAFAVLVKSQQRFGNVMWGIK